MIIQIINNIYICDVNYSYEKYIYTKYNINIVINCTENLKFFNNDKIKKIRIPLSYEMTTKDIYLLNNNLNKILSYIKTNLLDNVILICCYDGIRISPLIIALFILKYTKNINIKEITNFIKNKNENINLDYNFNVFNLSN
jgi:protein-tyrosine phosphatase